MDTTIRQATLQDAAAAANVMNAVIRERKYTALTNPFTVEEEHAFISGLGPRSAMFVAEFKQQLVGVQVIEPDGLAQYTDSMKHVATVGTWIHPNFRGYKIGGLLAEAVFVFARENGYKKIAIQVLANNARALRFYRNLGFEDIGIAKKHVQLDRCFHDVFYLEKFIGTERTS